MNANIEIYFQRQGPPLSILPLQQSLKHLHHCAQKHPKLVGEYKSLIMRIEHLQYQFVGAIKIRPSETNRCESLHLKQMVSHLVFDNIGSMHCPHCRKLIPSADIIYEHYQRGKHNSKAASGKRFYCPKSHLIFELLDFKL